MKIIESRQPIDGQEYSILVEVDEPRKVSRAGYDYGAQRSAASDRIIAGARNVFDDGLKLIQTTAKAVVTRIGELSEASRPDEVEVEFAIKLDAEAGAFIAKSSAEAQLTVTLKWARAKAAK